MLFSDRCQHEVFNVIDLNVSVEQQQIRKRQREIDGKLCVVCQKSRDGKDLIDPTKNKRAKIDEGILTLFRNLKAFQKTEQVPHNANLCALDAGAGIEDNFR